MIRTGIFGGSFNPIHKGHTALAEEICRQNIVNEMWLLVSPQNPLKQQQHLLPDALRLELARIAVKSYQNLKVSDFEFSLPRPSYMVDTLKHLQQAYPERSFTLVIGADNWLNFKRWFHYEDILNHYPIVVYPRAGCNLDLSRLPSNVRMLNLPLFPMSSTEIRRRMSEGESVSGFLEKEVEKRLQNYIQANPEAFQLTV